MNTIDKAPAPQTAAERHDRLGKKVGVLIGAALAATGVVIAANSQEAARHDIGSIAVDAPEGSELAADAHELSMQPVIYEYDVDALGKLTKRQDPGETPNKVQESLHSARDHLFGGNASLALGTGLGIAVSASAGVKLRRKRE